MQVVAAVRTGVSLLLVAALAGPWAVPTTEAADLVVPLNDCAQTDNGDPVVTALDISPRSVDLRDEPGPSP